MNDMTQILTAIEQGHMATVDAPWHLSDKDGQPVNKEPFLEKLKDAFSSDDDESAEETAELEETNEPLLKEPT